MRQKIEWRIMKLELRLEALADPSDVGAHGYKMARYAANDEIEFLKELQ